jgi:phenylalanyl-tRNA synthetase beta chain
MSDELDTMRTSLLPSLLAVARYNQNRTGERVDVFEMARVYHGVVDGGLAAEPVRLTVVARVGDEPGAGREGFLRLKAVMDRLAGDVAARSASYERAAPNMFHPGRTASIAVGAAQVGVLGELHPATLATFDLDGRAVALDIDVKALIDAAAERKAAELPRFPSAQRDIAVVVDEDIRAGDVQATIKEAGARFLEHVQAFDEYRGGQVPEGRKSIAFTLTFRSPERTLTDAEVEGAMVEIKRALEKRHRAGFRT